MPVALTGADATWLIRPDTTWCKPSIHPVWWNADAGRWDAVLPRDTGTSDDHYVAMGIEDGTPTFGPAINSQSTTRPDAWWDEMSGTLWVLFGHQSSTTIVRLSYSAGSYTVDGGFPVTVPGIQIEQEFSSPIASDPNNESPVALYRTPNGDLWVANTAEFNNGSSDPRVEVNRSTDNGATWDTAVNLNSGIGNPGVTVMGHVTDSGTTKLVLYSTRNGGDGVDAYSIDQDAAAITAGNWATETLPSPVGTETSDDHACAVTYNGTMYVVYKTTSPDGAEPLIGLHVRPSGGAWSQHTVVLGPDTSPRPTRPSIVVDSDNAVLYLFYGEISGSQRVMQMTADLVDLDTWSAPAVLISGGGTWSRGVIAPREPVTATSDLALIAYEDGNRDLWVETVTIDAGATVTPAAVVGAASVPSPTVAAGAAVTPTAVAAAVSVPSPTLSAGVTVTPSSVSASAAVPAPALSTGSTIEPTTVAASASVGSPTVAAGSTVAPATIAATASIPAPTVVAESSATVTPAAVSATATVPPATISAGSTVSPATVTATASTAAPTIAAGSTVTPATVTATATIGAPTLGASSTVTPSAVIGTATVPAPAVSAGGSATVAADVVHGTVTIGAPTIAAGSTVTTSTVSAGASVPSPTVSAAATISPATVTATAAVPTVSVQASSTVTASVVAGTVTIPAATVTLEGLPDPNPFRLTHQEPAGVAYTEPTGITHRETFAITYQEPPA